MVSCDASRVQPKRQAKKDVKRFGANSFKSHDLHTATVSNFGLWDHATEQGCFIVRHGSVASNSTLPFLMASDGCKPEEVRKLAPGSTLDTYGTEKSLINCGHNVQTHRHMHTYTH